MASGSRIEQYRAIVGGCGYVAQGSRGFYFFRLIREFRVQNPAINNYPGSLRIVYQDRTLHHNRIEPTQRTRKSRWETHLNIPSSNASILTFAP